MLQYVPRLEFKSECYSHDSNPNTGDKLYTADNGSIYEQELFECKTKSICSTAFFNWRPYSVYLDTELNPLH